MTSRKSKQTLKIRVRGIESRSAVVVHCQGVIDGNTYAKLDDTMSDLLGSAYRYFVMDLGEVSYMSPERTRSSDDVDCRSDIYGLGATVYALLTGRPPFEGNSLPDLIHMVREDQPIKPKEFQMSIHDMFQDAVLHMLEKRPEDRYQTPGELLRDLDRVGTYANVNADKDGWVD